MRRLYLSIFALAVFATTDIYASDGGYERSQTIVYINGAKYYVHTVAAGETLYSIARTYGTTEAVIISHNRSAADGLKPDQTIKIPVNAQDAVSGNGESKKRRRDYELHTVAAGETLYSISRSYAVSIDTIINDNPDVDPTQLSVGTRLYIRRSEIGQTRETQVRNEWEEYRDNLNSVAPDGYTYYIVRAGETLYSLCRRFETTEDVIRSMNDLSEGLKVGNIIKLPSKKRTEITDFISQNTIAEDEIGTFSNIPHSKPLRAALMLPITKNGNISNNYIDFYRGFLLGLEDVKKTGHSVELTLFDTEQNPSKVEELMSKQFNGAEPDLIIGPVYENEMPAAVDYAEKHNIPIVSPLAALSTVDSRILFRMSPSQDVKYDKVRDLFDGSKEVTLIYGESVDTDFEQEILALLDGRRFATHKYVYEHPSVIERREKERARQGINSDEPLSPSDMTPLLRSGQNNVFVILSDNETEVDRILAAIASANIALTARERTVPHFVIFGNSKWNRYSNIDRSIFFRNRVILMSSYHSHRDNERIRAFDKRYATDFSAMPTLYTYRGYDAAVIFGLGMFSDIENGMTGKRYVPLQTPYEFERTEGKDMLVNTQWVRVNYNNDFTITTQ